MQAQYYISKSSLDVFTSQMQRFKSILQYCMQSSTACFDLTEAIPKLGGYSTTTVALYFNSAVHLLIASSALPTVCDNC
jgi:hypothetical protein